MIVILKIKNPKDGQPAGADDRLNFDERKVAVRRRIVEILALECRDVDLDAGTTLTRTESNTGRRDSTVARHVVVIEAIRLPRSCQPRVFPWKTDLNDLHSEFRRLQAAVFP